MQPNPLICHYNQPSVALMQGLLATQSTRAVIAENRLAFLNSEIPDPAHLERAVGLYEDLRRPDDPPYRIPYSRLDIERYMRLYPAHLLYLPWGTSPATLGQILTYISQNLGTLLDVSEITALIAEDPDETGALAITIDPMFHHPVWYGQLKLWQVPATDLRSLITQRHYPLLNPTLPYLS